MITFLYGPPGSGKTHTILSAMERDARNGVPSFLIVPEQETISAERRALQFLPPSAQLTAEVLNFSRLANRVFREYGGLCYHYVDAGAKKLLMWKTLRELAPLFESFDGSAGTEAALAESMLGAVSEMKAALVTPEMLEHVGNRLKTDDPLKKKVRDVALISASYTALVKESFDDSEDDLSHLAELLQNHDFFDGANVYIDSFTSYTAQQIRVITEMARSARNLTVTFSAPSPHADELYLASIIDASNRIRRATAAYPSETKCLSEIHRSSPPELRLLSDYLWRLDLSRDSLPTIPEKEQGPDTVRFFSADSIYSEAEIAALEILRLVRSGHRFRDIVVIARDASTWTGVLDFVFDKYGIPYFLSEKEDLISLPPLKLLLSALRILSYGWQRDDVISYLKSGLCGVTPADADLFEEYTATWEISGSTYKTDTDWDMNPDGFTGKLSTRGETILKAANRARSILIPPLTALEKDLGEAKTVKDESAALLRYLECVDLESSLKKLAEDEKERGEKRMYDIFSRLYETLTELLSRLALLFAEESDEPLSPENLSTAIRLLLESTSIGTIPTTVDEVTVGSANMLRASNVRTAILIGLCEGEFPAAVQENGLFSSAERNLLEDLGVSLSTSYAHRGSDELLYVSRAVAYPSEHLILTTHKTGEGGGVTRPSLAFLRAAALLPHVKIQTDRDIPLTDRIVTPRVSLDYYPLLRDSAAGEALRALYRERDCYQGVEDAARIPVSMPSCSVSTDCAEDIFGDRMTLSQSRLEKYVNCHFSYYCDYVLSLREKKQAVFSTGDAGNFLHRVLEQFFREATGENDTLGTFTREQIAEIADRVIDAYKKEILPPSLSMEEKGRLPHLYRRLRELSIMMIENILREFEASDFVPRFFELRIGGTNAPVPLRLTLKDGSILTLSGVIDRVDLCKKNGKLYVRIVDYKTGVKDFSLSDLAVGLNTQMLIYLFTICHASTFLEKELCGEPLGNTDAVLPAGALYHSSAISPVSLDTYPGGENETDVRMLAEEEFTRSGILSSDPEILRAMNRDLDPHYLAGTKINAKTGLVTGESLVSDEGFREIETEVHKTVRAIAEEMRSGIADAIPLEYKRRIPCTYCDMRPICRRSKDGSPSLEGQEPQNESR